MPKHIRELQRQAGVKFTSLRHTGGGHIRACLPNGAVVFLAATPSDWRASRNNVADIKKALQ